MCAGVSVHQYSSRAGLRDLRVSEDPSGDLDRPLPGSPPAAGQTALWSRQEQQTPVGGRSRDYRLLLVLLLHVHFIVYYL